MAETYDQIHAAAIIPAYNEAGRIANVMQAAFRADLVDLVIVVDDGSTDETHNTARDVLSSAALSNLGIVLRHAENRGKTNALSTGVEHAKKIGGASLRTLLFLDADSSPIWSRDTRANMKLWQIAVNSLHGTLREPLGSDIIEGRNNAFITLLARYIDELIKPVASGEEVMRTGMYHRNTLVDTALSLTGWGAHAGNRAIPVEIWDGLFKMLQKKGQQLRPWEIEGALNAYTHSLGKQGTFIMHGVVNVGSRVKAGGYFAGVGRMSRIHAQALWGTLKSRTPSN